MFVCTWPIPLALSRVWASDEKIQVNHGEKIFLEADFEVPSAGGQYANRGKSANSGRSPDSGQSTSCWKVAKSREAANRRKSASSGQVADIKQSKNRVQAAKSRQVAESRQTIKNGQSTDSQLISIGGGKSANGGELPSSRKMALNEEFSNIGKSANSGKSTTPSWGSYKSEKSAIGSDAIADQILHSGRPESRFH